MHALAGFGMLWQILARLWQALADFGQALAGFGMLWQILARLWQALAGFGRLWQALAGFGRLWQALAGFGRLVSPRLCYSKHCVSLQGIVNQLCALLIWSID